MSVLPQKQFDLLMRLMNNRKVFDTHDNCVQDSVRGVSGVLRASYSQVQRLFRDMRIEGLMTPVLDIYGTERLMVNPAFLYFHTFHDKRFHRAMYVLGGHEEAVVWLRVCRAGGRLIHPATGEEIGPFNSANDLGYACSYSKNDRDKERRVEGADGEVGPSMADALDGGVYDTKKDLVILRHWEKTGELDYSVYGETPLDTSPPSSYVPLPLEEKPPLTPEVRVVYNRVCPDEMRSCVEEASEYAEEYLESDAYKEWEEEQQLARDKGADYA
jgi:hypothetical protein